MDDIIVKGTPVNGTQTELTPEQTAAKATEDATAKVAADKAAADAALLDSNGNPKSEEVLAAEKAAESVSGKAETDAGGSGDVEDLKAKVTQRAKQVEDLVKDAGVNPSEMIKAADTDTGELSVADKAKLITKHGEAIADLIEGNIMKMVGDIKSLSAAKDTAVYKQLEDAFKGVTEQTGKESWKELSAWVKENVDKDIRKAYNSMLESGGVQATMAVKGMIESFNSRDPGTVKAELLDTESDGGGSSDMSMLSRTEYNDALDALLQKGHDYDTSTEVQKLNKRREKSINKGF